MEYTGKWKAYAFVSRDADDNIIYISPEEYINTVPAYLTGSSEEELEHEKQQRKMAASAIISIEDNKLYSLMPIPEGHTQEEIDEAVASGNVVLMDGLMLIETFDIKEVDGELYYDSGIEGELLGVQVDSFLKAFDSEGYLNIGSTRYVKM